MKEEELIKKINDLIEEIRPFLNMDGGDIEFVKYEDNYLYVRMMGACQNCMFQDNTLNEGVLSYFKTHIPTLEGVINIPL